MEEPEAEPETSQPDNCTIVLELHGEIQQFHVDQAEDQTNL